MYIDIATDFLIDEKDIVGIFDLDNTTVSKRSREYLNSSEKKGEVKILTFDLPKTFIVCSNKKGDNRIYLSQFSTGTHVKRINYKEIY